VTVFVPVHNRERYVSDAIQSILAQSYGDFELLLVDDGSTDRSVEVMRSFDDPRIRIVENGENLGIPRTRNRGLELARGEYIALLDSDDRMLPERLEQQVAFLDQHPDHAEVGAWCRMMDEDGRPLRRIKRQPVSPEDCRVQLLFRCCLSNRTILGRTALLREKGYRNDYPRCQDYDLHVRLAEEHLLGNLPRVLVLGRIHAGQITAQTSELGDTKKRLIVAGQLERLGVAFAESDLDPHLTLSRMRKLRFRPDAAYLDWAEDWLVRIGEANQRTRRYDDRALTRALSEKWLVACWAARAGLGWRIWERYRVSTLGAGAGSSLRRHLVASIGRTLPASLR
jgi:glycosyltransferase involved in cell wall biosynthesis